MVTDRQMWIIAGPPGAGKSVLTEQLFPHWIGTSRHIDADAPLAAGLAAETLVPLAKRLETAEAGGRSFAVETRMLDRAPLGAALRLRRRGWGTALIYLALPRIDLCRQRIRARALRGGADIDEDVLEQGFNAALGNLAQHVDAAERWLILDASGVRAPVIARGAYAAAVQVQADALGGLLPHYPFLPASSAVRADTWADGIAATFTRTRAWQTRLDQLIALAADMQARQLSS